MIAVVFANLQVQAQNGFDPFGVGVLKKQKSSVEGGVIRQGNGPASLGHGMVHQIVNRAAPWDPQRKLGMAMQVNKPGNGRFGSDTALCDRIVGKGLG